jgi:hypothetical protein
MSGPARTCAGTLGPLTPAHVYTCTRMSYWATVAKHRDMLDEACAFSPHQIPTVRALT